jgi:uncharacterized protein YjbI with pentapeptide repeats
MSHFDNHISIALSASTSPRIASTSIAIRPGDEPPAEDSSKKHDPDFFLALAAKGKDAWNAWRRDPANKDVRVTFAGIDFSEAPRDEIDFSGFEFGDDADFSHCNWRGLERKEIENDTIVFKPGRAFFVGAAFGKDVRFAGAAFGGFANFTGAAFGDYSSFVGAIFGDEADFDGAAFGEVAIFTGATFHEHPSFAGVTCGDLAFFAGAALGRACFNNAYFKGSAVFIGMAKVQWGPGGAVLSRYERQDERQGSPYSADPTE